MTLEETYRAYLKALNDRELEQLAHFVHDTLTYNDKAITRQQYADMIAADIAAIPDLRFDARILVTDGDRVACRLLFECTPQREFLGFIPNGRRLTFAEHVFHDFRDGRIAAVTSLIDRFGIQSQLHATY